MGVEKLNALDRKRRGFICTEERDDLCEALKELVSASGFPELEDVSEQWRN